MASELAPLAFPLAGDRLRRLAPALARALVARFVDEIPFYGLLPAEQLSGEITAIVEGNLLLLSTLLSEGRGSTSEELAALRFSAARRAQEGIPLDAMLTAYQLGAHAAWRELAEEPAGADAYDLASAFFGAVERTCAAIVAAYIEERQAISGVEREERRQLLDALLADETVDRIGRPAGIRIPAEYAVLSLAVGARPDEETTGPAGAIATNRKLRRLRRRSSASPVSRCCARLSEAKRPSCCRSTAVPCLMSQPAGRRSRRSSANWPTRAVQR